MKKYIIKRDELKKTLHLEDESQNILIQFFNVADRGLMKKFIKNWTKFGLAMKDSIGCFYKDELLFVFNRKGITLTGDLVGQKGEVLFTVGNFGGLFSKRKFDVIDSKNSKVYQIFREKNPSKVLCKRKDGSLVSEVILPTGFLPFARSKREYSLISYTDKMNELCPSFAQLIIMELFR